MSSSPAAKIAAVTPIEQRRVGRLSPVSSRADFDRMVVPVGADPVDAPPQRGHLSAEDAARLSAVIKVASALGRTVLGIDNALEQDVERTPARESKVAAAVRCLLASGRVETCGLSREAFASAVNAELFGLGPLDRFVQASDVSEIMVNGPWIIFIEREGQLTESGHKFLDDEHVLRVIQRIVRPIGREVSPDSPLVDARLADGSRVNAAISPCTLDGPSITIRKFGNRRFALDDMVELGSMSDKMAAFLAAIVQCRQNIVVSGGTGSGKTTLINAMSAFIGDGERVVTIEDAAELRLVQRNVVRMETKKPTLNSAREVPIRGLLANALRMRPERILVGECRGGEALDMLQAMNTGHDGSMTTVHANNPRQCISRLETLTMMAGLDLPVYVIRRQISAAVNFIVQASRLRDGSRKVTHISEVLGMEGETVVMSDLFRFEERGADDGKVVGEFVPTGNRPACVKDLERQGIRFGPQFFSR